MKSPEAEFIKKLKRDRVELLCQFEELFINVKDHISPEYEKRYGKVIAKYNKILGNEAKDRNFKAI